MGDPSIDIVDLPVLDVAVQIAGHEHLVYAEDVCSLIEEAARHRGTGIAKRKPEYIRGKIQEGKAIIALRGDELAGFCYIETWTHNKYVAKSGLIVVPQFRKMGLAKRIKRAAFELSREKYPDARLFGITTSLAVMKINSELGWHPSMRGDRRAALGGPSCHHSQSILARSPW